MMAFNLPTTALPDIPPAELIFESFAILISIIAVIYWVKLIRRIQITSREDAGWIWIFMAVIMVLLINIAGVMLFFSTSQIHMGSLDRILKIDASTLAFIETMYRSVIAMTITIGSYLLYNTVKGKNLKFKMTPVIPVIEEGNKTDGKFKMESGASYLIPESPERKIKAVDVFVDLVMHNEAGLYLTRRYPPKLRQDFGLQKTPIFWLSGDKEYHYSINPSDLVSITQVIKEFISKSTNSVVLLEGLEYLVVQNDFESVIKMLQSLDDAVSKSTSKLIVNVDPSAVSTQQYHLLERELKEFSIQ